MSSSGEISVPSDVEEAISQSIFTSDENNNDSNQLLLAQLLLSSSSTDRGQLASTEEKEKMELLIQQMEAIQDESAQPTMKDKMMTGTWDLVYSDTQLFRSSPFFMAGRAVCKTTEEAERYDWFCDMHRAALAISTIGKVRQVIVQNKRIVSEFEVKVGSIPFLNDIIPFSYSGGLPGTIDGAIVSTADITPTADGKSWEIYMDTVEIKGSNIPLLRRLLDMPQVKLESRSLAAVLENTAPDYETPRPIFTTTYLDDKLRISRDQDGKVFVYTKVSESDTPKEYKEVDSDLGIGKLLEGVNDNFFKFYI
eukprot:CAMPEP_0197833044 /NCGR_PEP_ID=MMETSP1437-20131217/17369_1 /TAXON_ID=49252 ORGANISM="Eucampia antarctica, Strain CCMP1452" /NCGR_SAMPLE_ID=MMETSP1437 /ASSEMBLY_ACC=CAM_ASM_001096 /LENGTH=308 /DNA_ID=CAMNT_0043436793 /DNA_START=237 /DNA_END=1163 /DNA_ORIENTATION=+